MKSYIKAMTLIMVSISLASCGGTGLVKKNNSASSTQVSTKEKAIPEKYFLGENYTALPKVLKDKSFKSFYPGIKVSFEDIVNDGYVRFFNNVGSSLSNTSSGAGGTKDVSGLAVKLMFNGFSGDNVLYKDMLKIHKTNEGRLKSYTFKNKRFLDQKRKNYDVLIFDFHSGLMKGVGLSEYSYIKLDKPSDEMLLKDVFSYGTESVYYKEFQVATNYVYDYIHKHKKGYISKKIISNPVYMNKDFTQSFDLIDEYVDEVIKNDDINEAKDIYKRYKFYKEEEARGLSQNNMVRMKNTLHKLKKYITFN